jgi:hypothetical protein
VFVSDGSNPFETAQGRFLTGQVIPLVVGAFGDVNEELEKVLKQVAKAAAAGTEGLTISPLINTDRKGGAFQIMHQQFRRAIGCATVRGQAKLTLGRLHYVRATREEAASVCKSHHSDNRYGHQVREADHHGSTDTQRRDIQLLSNFGMAITTLCLIRG